MPYLPVPRPPRLQPRALALALALGTLSLLLGTATAAAQPLPGMGYVNVADPPYSARGNGIDDDGPSIQRALDDIGARGGGRVFLPAATYRVMGHLSIPANTTLAGTFSGPPKSVRDMWPAPNPTVPEVAGSLLLAFAGHGDPAAPPLITLASYNATLEGVAIYYPNQRHSNPPVEYPWTVALGPWPTTGPQTFGAENATIQNVVLINSYNGIDLASQPSARHTVRGVYGQPLRTGIQVDQCWDVGRISDVHFNQLWTSNAEIARFQLDQGFAFVFFRTDGELVRDVFAWGYHVGMLFAASPRMSPDDPGCFNIDCSPDVQLTNVSFDNTDVGLDIYDTKPNGVTVSNYAYANQGRGASRFGVIQHAGTRGYASITNGKFWGAMRQAVRWEGSGSLSLQNSHLVQWGIAAGGKADPALAAVEVVGGRAMIQGNLFFPQFRPNGTPVALRAVSLDAAVKAMVTGNMLNGNTLAFVPGPTVLIGGNQW